MTKKITLLALFICVLVVSKAQYKSYLISTNKDTINIIDKKNRMQGKWVVRVPELRGNMGYEEEGMYKDSLKEGIWRRYTLEGDAIGFESFLHGNKDGAQQYFSAFGILLREESWRAYNKDAPYDTIPIYGTGSGEILRYQVVKAIPYSVKHGTWVYYNPENGEPIKTEKWERNVLILPKAQPAPAQASSGKSLGGVKKVVAKTPEMLEWERKNKGKKGAIRNGATSL
jgi:hypothetical protein